MVLRKFARRGRKPALFFVRRLRREPVPDLSAHLVAFEHALAGEQIEVAEGFGDGLGEAARGEAGELAASDAEGGVGVLFEEPADASGASGVVGVEAPEQRLWLLDGLAVAGEDAADVELADAGDGVHEGRE